MATHILQGTARPELATTAPGCAPESIAQARDRRRTDRDDPTADDFGKFTNETDEPGTYLPSPERIAAECAVIRAGWSPLETRLRLAGSVPNATGTGRRKQLRRRQLRGWTVPECACGSRGDA